MSESGETDRAKGSKKKHKKQKLFDYNRDTAEDASPELHVKTEQDSDQSTSKKKKKKSKHKHKFSMKLEKKCTDDEEFLNIKVKEEDSKLQLLDECTSIKQELVKSDENSDIKPKHKKAKKKKHNSFNQSDGEDKVNIKQHNFTLEGMEKEDDVKVKHKKKHKNANHEENQLSQDEYMSHLEENRSQTESQSRDDSFIDTNHKSKKKKHHANSHEDRKVINGMEIDNNFSAEETVINSTKKIMESVKTKKLSEQIVFEEEMEEPNISNLNSVPSGMAAVVRCGDRRQAEACLEQFVVSLGSKWGRVGVGVGAGVGAGQDDVWVLRAPRGVVGVRSVELHARADRGSRLKAASCTLHGALRHDREAALVLTSCRTLRLLPLQGDVSFHRALPDRGANESPPDREPSPTYIPLPDTKTRHPLFGADYTQAILLPRTVAENLKRATKLKKKSKKAERVDRMETTTVEVAADLNHVKVEKKKKKKKRKLSVASEEVVGVESGECEVSEPKRKKKKKHRADNNGDVWHSAKQMEETLFNF